MANVEIRLIESVADLKAEARTIGIVYFQIYEKEPNPEFYNRMPPLLPYERVVEVRTNRWVQLKREVSFKGDVPFFGAVNAGWVLAVTGSPDEVPDIVRFGRRQGILPEQIRQIRQRPKTDVIVVEGTAGMDEKALRALLDGKPKEPPG